MKNNITNKDFDKIFDSCAEICQNCTNCAHKCSILPPKSTSLNKIRQTMSSFDKLCPCKTMMLLSRAGKINNMTTQTNFERVKFFYATKLFLKEHCSGDVAKIYEKKIDREWAQVVLFTYMALPNICKIIEDVIDQKALARSLNLGLNVEHENTFKQVNNMLDFLDRKTRMTNLHVRATRAISELPAKLKETAEMRYFERKSALEMAEKLQISLRTAQRRTEKLLDEFVPLLKKYGLDSKHLLFEIGRTEPWMLQWFKFNI